MTAWLNRAVAFFLAWTIVLLGLGFANVLLSGTALAPYEIGWICIGVGVRLCQTQPMRLPAENRVDFLGALLFLGSCAVWPWRRQRS